jgi:hypothetical protein
LLVRSLAWRTHGARAETLREGIVAVTVPAVNMLVAWSPREVLVPAGALLRVFKWECLLLFSCHRLIDFPVNFLSYFFFGPDIS